jgi:hypothetical protein
MFSIRIEERLHIVAIITPLLSGLPTIAMRFPLLVQALKQCNSHVRVHLYVIDGRWNVMFA